MGLKKAQPVNKPDRIYPRSKKVDNPSAGWLFHRWAGLFPVISKLSLNKMIKQLLNKIFWLLVAIFGAGLSFFEIGMALSEPHVLNQFDIGIVIWILLILLGIALFFLGLTKLRGNPSLKK